MRIFQATHSLSPVSSDSSTVSESRPRFVAVEPREAFFAGEVTGRYFGYDVKLCYLFGLGLVLMNGPEGWFEILVTPFPIS